MCFFNPNLTKLVYKIFRLLKNSYSNLALNLTLLIGTIGFSLPSIESNI